MKNLILLLLVLTGSFRLYAQVSPDEALAVQYFQNGEYEKAAPLYEKLIAKSRNSIFYDPYFTSLLKSRNYSEAEAVARKYQKTNPDNFTYAVDIGRVLQERGEAEKASAWFDDLIRKMPANEFAIKDLAITFYRAEAYEHSVKAYVGGRKLLNDPNAFVYDLVSIYRFRKNKPMLMQEYLQLLDVNPGALTQAQNVLANILDEKADYEMLKSALLKKLQKDPQNVALTELLTWQYVQQKEFDMALRQTLALDKRLKEDGERVFELSRVLLANKAFDAAVTALNYLVAKGREGFYYIPAKVELLTTRASQLRSAKFSQPELLSLESEYKSLLEEFGKSAHTAFAIRQLANLQAFYLKKPEDAIRLLEELLELPALPPGIAGQAKLELGDIHVLGGDVWEASLLYGQVEKQFANEPYGQEGKFKNAKLAYYQGDFVWAKAQLDVLKSSTSQLISNDALNLSLTISDNLQDQNDSAALTTFAYADLLVFRNKSDEALKLLDSLNLLFPGNSLSDDILMSKARIFISRNEHEQAIKYLEQIVSTYSEELWGDDAVFMLADIFENSVNQPARALLLYEKVITQYPGSLFVVEARKRFRQLRGDLPGTS